MSSTNRGAYTGHLRHPDDYYETPEWAVRAVLPHLPLGPLIHGRILEPGAGTGSIVKVLLAAGAVDITAVEVDAGRAEACAGVTSDSRLEVLRADFLSTAPETSFDLCVMNPPFHLAMQFVEHARSQCAVVCALLRLAFLASKKRSAWHRANRSNMYVLDQRPSFTADNKTDSADYAWFVWGAEYGGKYEVLDGSKFKTGKKERSNGEEAHG